VIRSRWWALAVGVVSTVCAVLIAAAIPGAPLWWVGAIALAAFVAYFFTLGGGGGGGGAGGAGV
jgi:hypothetical protein